MRDGSDTANALTVLYRSTLPALISSIEHLQGRLLSEQPESAAAALRRTAHALRGSGATYGFAAISQAAASVEEAEPAALAAAVEALLDVLRQAVTHDTAEADVVEFRTQRPRRILLVDDDPSILLLAGLLLRRAGHAVAEAGDGVAAAAIFGGFRPDLLIADVLLGDEDGIELALRLQAQDAALQLVFLTAAHDKLRFDRMLALQPAAILHKPFDPALLALMLDQRLGARA